MNNPMKIVSSAIALLYLFSWSHSATASVAGANGIQVPIEARALGMGGLGCALLSDFGEMGMNPGNLIQHRGVTVTWGPHVGAINQLVPDLSDNIYNTYSSLRVAAPDLGFARPHIWMLRRSLNFGESSFFPNEDPLPFTEQYETVGMGLSLLGCIGVGIAKTSYHINHGIYPARATGIDYGMTCLPKLDFISGTLLLGLSWSNVGKPYYIQAFGSEINLPRYFRYGFSYQGATPTEGPGGPWIWTVGAEITELQVQGGERTSQMGFELRGERLAFRGGYIHDPDGDVTNFTMGLGYRHEILDLLAIRVDIANLPQASDLDRTWKGSISFQLHPVK